MSYINTNKTVGGIIIPVIVLTGIGILMVYSSSVFISKAKFGSSFHYLWRHLFTVFIGATVMVFIAKLDYRKLRVLVIPLLILSAVLLVLVFVPGIGVSAGPHSAVQRWIRLWPSTFQPSELVKITLVIFLADYISRNIQKMKDFRCGVMIPVAVMGIFQCIIMLQPDFGAAMSIGLITITLLFVGGIKWRYIFSMMLLSIPVIYVLILSAPYRMKRILAFLDPWQDAQGSGFQLVQSFLAFGRGGILGVGIGHSKQKLFFLPEAHTDFIFSLIGEEMGMIGVLTVMGLFICLIVKGFRISMQTDDSFGYYLALGLTVMIGSQALINFAVSTGVIPTKGLPLPFISYGGSAFLVNMAAAGILINISKNWNSSLTGRGERIGCRERLVDKKSSNNPFSSSSHDNSSVRSRRDVRYSRWSDYR